MTDEQEEEIMSLFGFCGCGVPQAAITTIHECLKRIKYHTDDTQYSKEGYENLNAYPTDEGSRYIIWYLLDAKGFTEHGGSVPGWLTPEGYDLLKKLDSYAV